jgi:hemerythrin|tara:strand:+ start:127 stop:303 length:177 start_codon:yes stop_codon:yes gene_type:complete
MDGTKKEEYNEWVKKLGHPEYEMAKKEHECIACKDTREKRQKKSSSQRIVAYALNDNL